MTETTVTVNGEARHLSADATVVDAVAAVTTASSGVAVAVNGVVVPKSEWATTPVAASDRVEVLTAVQGG